MRVTNFQPLFNEAAMGPGDEKETVQRKRKAKVSFGEVRRLLKEEVTFLKGVLSDPRTPKASRWLLSLALAYALSPLDLIPDFIPIVGHVDDLIVIPALVFLALRMIPREVISEHKGKRTVPTEVPGPNT